MSSSHPAERVASCDLATTTIQAPAKLNLSLAVLGKRDDGLHEIESLMLPVTLHDTLHVRATEGPAITLQVGFAGRLAEGAAQALNRDVPVDATNLVVRAAQALAREAGVQKGLAIELIKEIPSGAGLGGGSSDAAAVLMAASQVWGLNWPRERLAAIGAEIGSDIPWFFAGGPAIARGRGERVEPVSGIPPLSVAIVCPAVGLSTASVYARCVPDGSRRGLAPQLVAALNQGLSAAALSLLYNALEQPAREICPEVTQLLADLSAAGAVRPMMTGSGSACFALVPSRSEAEQIAARLEALEVRHTKLWPGVFVVGFGGN